MMSLNKMDVEGETGVTSSTQQKQQCMDLFIANLPYQGTEDDVHEVCRAYGKLVGVKLIKERNRKYGFIRFQDFESETQLLKDGGLWVLDRYCTVAISLRAMKNKFGGGVSVSARPLELMVFNLTPHTVEKDLDDYFIKFGSIAYSKVSKSGMGFVRFYDLAAQRSVLASSEVHRIRDTVCTVKICDRSPYNIRIRQQQCMNQILVPAEPVDRSDGGTSLDRGGASVAAESSQPQQTSHQVFSSQSGFSPPAENWDQDMEVVEASNGEQKGGENRRLSGAQGENGENSCHGEGGERQEKENQSYGKGEKGRGRKDSRHGGSGSRREESQEDWDREKGSHCTFSFLTGWKSRPAHEAKGSLKAPDRSRVGKEGQQRKERVSTLQGTVEIMDLSREPSPPPARPRVGEEGRHQREERFTNYQVTDGFVNLTPQLLRPQRANSPVLKQAGSGEPVKDHSKHVKECPYCCLAPGKAYVNPEYRGIPWHFKNQTRGHGQGRDHVHASGPSRNNWGGRGGFQDQNSASKRRASFSELHSSSHAETDVTPCKKPNRDTRPTEGGRGHVGGTSRGPSSSSVSHTPRAGTSTKRTSHSPSKPHGSSSRSASGPHGPPLLVSGGHTSRHSSEHPKSRDAKQKSTQSSLPARHTSSSVEQPAAVEVSRAEHPPPLLAQHSVSSQVNPSSSTLHPPKPLVLDKSSVPPQPNTNPKKPSGLDSLAPRCIQEVAPLKPSDVTNSSALVPLAPPTAVSVPQRPSPGPSFSQRVPVLTSSIQANVVTNLVELRCTNNVSGVTEVRMARVSNIEASSDMPTVYLRFLND